MNPAEHIDANVPEDIRDFAVWFCETYRIDGICDPQYISNITAMYLGRGDGQSNFGDGLSDPYAFDPQIGRSLIDRGKSRYAALRDRLCTSYGVMSPDATAVFTKLACLRMVAVS